MKYHVKWIETPDDEHGKPKATKTIVYEASLPALIESIIDNGGVVIQCEPI